MAVNFIHAGQKVYVDKSPEGTRTKELKPALYTIEYSREEGFYLLEIADSYTLPEKMYGNHVAAAEKVIKTYLAKKGNTGILLTGLKGTGKSLFVKVISNLLIGFGSPVIQINKPYPGEDLFNLIENVGTCALVFDEFGKNYSLYDGGRNPTQAGLLSLLDGLTNAKRLHLFTENKERDISDLLINRPGRVHYHFKYDRLSSAVIKELCEDNNLPKEQTKELVDLSIKLKVLSFDIVKCLIDEWKLHGGSFADLIKDLNISLCRTPGQEAIKVVNFTLPNGTSIEPKYLFIHEGSDDRISIETTDEYRNNPNSATRSIYTTLYLTDAIMILDDNYHFLDQNGNSIVLKINKN